MAFVALISDAASRYAHIYVPAQTWKEVIDILEDKGCEVVEDQTEDYDMSDLITAEARKEYGVCTVDELVHSQKNKCGFIPFN